MLWLLNYIILIVDDFLNQHYTTDIYKYFITLQNILLWSFISCIWKELFFIFKYPHKIPLYISACQWANQWKWLVYVCREMLPWRRAKERSRMIGCLTSRGRIWCDSASWHLAFLRAFWMTLWKRRISGRR